MIVFYDFEVFKYDWLVVLIDPFTGKETVVINDKDKLESFYNDHKNDIWIGYNSKNYDQYILKAILCGFDPKDVNDFIIVKGRDGWQYSHLLSQFPLNNYDTMSVFHGLKQLEAFMGNNIKETSVPFDIQRKLTKEEIAETVRYCRHDVEQTIEVFLERKEMFDSQIGIIKAFKLPISYISKTQAQLVASVLGATKHEYHDEFDIKIPDTLRLDKYKYILDWYLDPENRTYDRYLDTVVSGIPHSFGWGGVHGAIPKYIGTGKFIMADVASLYPSLMIRYNYFSRSIKDPQKYVEIYETNLRMKKEKNPLRPAYKLICNTTYGCFKDVYNPLYDPQMANNICVAGQLLLLDLIEKLEPYCELIQSNTDGILIKYDDTDKTFNIIDDIVYEWEQRTGLNMEFSDYMRVVQGDVNNYIAVSPEGKVKAKGAYVKKLSRVDNDLAIVNEAIVNRLTKDIPVEQTIIGCNDLIKFQKVVKVSSKYSYGTWNGIRQNEKTFRVFASKDPNDGIIGKVKTNKIEKFANTPERCFIDNDDVKDKPCPDKLDKTWYIELSKRRLQEKFNIGG